MLSDSANNGSSLTPHDLRVGQQSIVRVALVIVRFVLSGCRITVRVTLRLGLLYKNVLLVVDALINRQIDLIKHNTVRGNTVSLINLHYISNDKVTNEN